MNLKVLHILQDTILAGSQRVALDILRGLPSSEYEKVAVTGEPTAHEAEFHALAEEAGTRIVRVSSLRRPFGLGDLRALADLTEVCRSERPDVVHTHSSKPFILGRAAGRLAGVPHLVHTLHGIAFHGHQRRRFQALYWLLENAGAAIGGTIVSVNRYYLGRFIGVSPARWRVIHNGVDPARAQGEGRPPGPEGPRIILFPSRLSPQKDPLTFLRAAEKLLEDPSLRDSLAFEITGGGSLSREVERFVESRPLLRERCRTFGWVHDLRPHYARAWAVCVPSRWEAFGLVVAEAALWGVPAVASDAEGLPELVLDGETGLLSPPGDVLALERNLRRIVEDDALRNRMGEAARRRVVQDFTLTKMQKAYRDLYQELAGVAT